MTTRQTTEAPAVPELLPPFDRLRQRLGDRLEIGPYYSGPFQKYHHSMSHDSQWDLDALGEAARRASGRILDLGCGSGRVSLYLAGHGHTVTGVDRSPDAVAGLRTLADERGLGDLVDARVVDVAADGPARAGESFGLAVMGDVTVNSFAPAELAAAVRNVAPGLDPAGGFCLTVFGDEALASMTRFSTPIPVEPSHFEDDHRTVLVWTAIRFAEETRTLTRQFLLQEPGDGTVRLAVLTDTIWTRSSLTEAMAAEGYGERGAVLCSVGSGGASGWPVWAVEYGPV
ncbi:class I SAM-dependent methyltransferase [Longispora urticae]